jgi:hypothetical protein
MVTVIVPGESIRGFLNYNENKVKTGAAVCIHAAGFGMEAKELTFNNKWNRFSDLVAHNKICKANAYHISINFAPGEILSKSKLTRIADSYMERIGFGDQPYLVYQHFDAAHPHLHVVSTNVTATGDLIDTDFIGKRKSSPARKAIEIEFGLVKAGGRSNESVYELEPASLSIAQYGKEPTRAAIVNRVRSVVKHYKFTSLQELNAVLKPLNILADRGNPETQKFKKGGLTYTLINEKGESVGIAVKASSIYGKPTLKSLADIYKTNAADRKEYSARICSIIEQILDEGVNREMFISRLHESGINAVFSQNADGLIYGVTFIDHKTHCVFKGSDLDKGYSAKAILERLVEGDTAEIIQTKKMLEDIIGKTDFTPSIAQVLATWAAQGLTLWAHSDTSGTSRYRLGRLGAGRGSAIPADKRMTGYFRANVITEKITRLINRLLGLAVGNSKNTNPDPNLSAPAQLAAIASDYFKNIFSIIIDSGYSHNTLPHELLREAKKKKKRYR